METGLKRTTKIINVARGIVPADLILKNASLVNVFTGEIYSADIAVTEGVIAGIGEYINSAETVDLKQKYLLPGFINGHIHIESSMLVPENFAAAVLPHGTTAVVADPHEIVNVWGLKGFKYMIDASANLPLDFFYMIPSCVPATHMETAGAKMEIDDIVSAWQMHPQSPGLAEMMNFPGIVKAMPETLAKTETAIKEGKLIDGHAPLLGGKDLSAYISTGISSDHECSLPEEVMEKMRQGMYIAVREGSAAKNMAEILPVINDHNIARTFFCCDDRNPHDLINEGDMAGIIRKAVKLGLSPVNSVRMATINTALHYNLKNRGAIAPGYIADMVVVENLQDFEIKCVYKNGILVAKDYKLTGTVIKSKAKKTGSSVSIPDLKDKIKILAPSSQDTKLKVIELKAQSIITGSKMIAYKEIASSKEILMVAVIERHGKNGNVAMGYVKGFGAIEGALASTVAHDSHNLIIVGSSPEDFLVAAQKIKAMQGGLAVVSKGKTIASLPLPIAGLMSEKDVFTVSGQHRSLIKAAQDIGCVIPDPFMSMSFLSLPVIPALKITDKGLVDVNNFKIVPIFD